jgi:hypothetical protein
MKMEKINEDIAASGKIGVKDVFKGIIAPLVVSLGTAIAGKASEGFGKWLQSMLEEFALYIGIVLTGVSILLLSVAKIRIKKPIAISLGIMGIIMFACSIISGKITDQEPVYKAEVTDLELVYKTEITPETINGKSEVFIPDSYNGLLLRVDGKSTHGFLFELEKIGSANPEKAEKLIIQELENAGIIASQFYHIQPGEFMVSGTFEKGDVVWINLLNFAEFAGKINLELLGSKKQGAGK